MFALRRREFIAALVGAMAWPLAGRAQQPNRMRRMGWLDFYRESDPGARADDIAFRQGIEEQGWTVGQNLAIDYRWGVFDAERARVAAAELLNLAPDVILSVGSPGTLALQQATRTVPIVFTAVTEPLAQRIVQSLEHPGGNITGFSYLEPTVGAKWLELLKEIAPHVTRIAFVFNPNSSPYSRLFYQSTEAGALKFAVQAMMAPVHDTGEIEQVMTMLGREPGGGLIIPPDAFNYTNRKLIIELAARHQLPAIYGSPGTAADGGLIYYSVDIVDQHRKAAVYVDRIFRGAKPADLPVQQPTKFSLTVNTKTAKALGLRLSNSLLVSADEVIE